MLFNSVASSCHSRADDALVWVFADYPPYIETTRLTRLYTITDKLLAHQNEIEQFLYQRECSLFDLKQTIVLYDLTNTFFEGSTTLKQF